MSPKTNFLILVSFIIITVNCTDIPQVIQAGCPSTPNEQYIANNAYQDFYYRLGRGIDITSASLIDWNVKFQSNLDSIPAFKNQVYKYKYLKTDSSDTTSGCPTGTIYPFLGSVKCFATDQLNFYNFVVLNQADLIKVLHFIYSSHEGFERKSWMNNVSVRELLQKFKLDSNKNWLVTIGEYPIRKYNMDFSNANCDHYLTQTFINRLYPLGPIGDTTDLYQDFIKDYGTSTISDVTLGGMVIAIQSYPDVNTPPADVITENALKALPNLYFVGGNRAALEEKLVNDATPAIIFDTFKSTYTQFPAIIRIQTASLGSALSIIHQSRGDLIKTFIKTYVDRVSYIVGFDVSMNSNPSFFNAWTDSSLLAPATTLQKVAVIYSDGTIETSNDFTKVFTKTDLTIYDFNIYFLNEPQISKQYSDTKFDWSYLQYGVSPPYLVESSWLKQFQLHGRQEKEQICIVVNGAVKDVSAPILLNQESKDFNSLLVYTTPYQDCGTFPLVVFDLPSTPTRSSTFGMRVMFQSGQVVSIGNNQEASFKNENIVDFWLLYYTEELTLHYQNSNHNIHYRIVSPTYPTRARLENHRRVTRIERFLESDRNTGWRMAFIFNRGAQVYCDYSGCNLPTDLKQIRFIDESGHEINRLPYY